jgi:RNA polymerase sigma factor (sigma-70 family)
MDWSEIYTRLRSDREDQLAWEAMKRRIRIWASAQLRNVPWHVLDDLVADTCSAVAISLGRARDAEHFAGFVWGFYLNERHRSRNEQRRASRVVELNDLGALDLPNSDPFIGEDMGLVWQALGELPQRYRAAVSLRYLEDLPAADIARELGVSPGNARQLVYVGLSRMRRRLQQSNATTSTTEPPVRPAARPTRSE